MSLWWEILGYDSLDEANRDIASIVNKSRGSNVEYYSMNEGSLEQRRAMVDRYVDDITNKLVPLFEDYPGLIGTSMLVNKNIITNAELRDYARAEIKKKAPLFTKRSKNNIYSKKKYNTSLVRSLTDLQILELNKKNVKNFTLSSPVAVMAPLRASMKSSSLT